MNRVPEYEPMDDPDEIEAYDTLSKRYLRLVENLFVKRARRLLNRNVPHPLILDIGVGPGHIPVRFSRNNPSARFVAVDLSLDMLRKTRENIARAGLGNKILLVCADAKNLPFRDESFSFGYSHSTFHHMTDPCPAIREMIRVMKQKAKFIIRDLRRPPSPFFEWYVRIFGYPYNALMKKMYRESLRAGYTFGEMKRICRSIDSAECTPRRFFVTHVGIEGIKNTVMSNER